MLRFILVRRFKDQYNGLETETFETFDLDNQELETILLRGGSSEGGYDITDMVGVSIIQN